MTELLQQPCEPCEPNCQLQPENPIDSLALVLSDNPEGRNFEFNATWERHYKAGQLGAYKAGQVSPNLRCENDFIRSLLTQISLKISPVCKSPQKRSNKREWCASDFYKAIYPNIPHGPPPTDFGAQVTPIRPLSHESGKSARGTPIKPLTLHFVWSYSAPVQDSSA